MAEPELSLEESDARRRQEIAAAEQAVLELIARENVRSAQELRNALAHGGLDFDRGTLRTALLRLLTRPEGLFAERAAPAAQ